MLFYDVSLDKKGNVLVLRYVAGAAGIFFSLSNSLYEFVLGHSMNIFRINWRA